MDEMSELVKGKKKNTIEINVFLISIKSLYVAYWLDIIMRPSDCSAFFLLHTRVKFMLLMLKL